MSAFLSGTLQCTTILGSFFKKKKDFFPPIEQCGSHSLWAKNKF